MLPRLCTTWQTLLEKRRSDCSAVACAEMRTFAEPAPPRGRLRAAAVGSVCGVVVASDEGSAAGWGEAQLRAALKVIWLGKFSPRH